jgi:NAD(P)-dependent dehydrogenase (short-subunit alcohol dehydrogenase family)
MVTGAGSGIGRAMAEAFDAEEARVLVVDIDSDAAARTVEALRAASAFTADVADPDAVASLFERVADEVGAVDVLCNNAGIFDGYKPAGETELELWDRVIGVNLRGPFLLSAAAIPGMIERGGGAIVNTASIAALGAGGGGAAYTASKHGLLGLTRQLAFDYGRFGIRVNAICPGVVATSMSDPVEAAPGEPPPPAYVVEGDEHTDRMVAVTPARRWAQPGEIASVAVFLAGDEASFLHGAAVTADGGWTLI